MQVNNKHLTYFNNYLIITMQKMKTKTMGERLKSLREEYHLSQDKLAALVEMSKVALYNIEHGISKSKNDNIEKIALKLGSSFEWLQHGKGEMLPNGKIELKMPSAKKEVAQFNPAVDTLYKEMRERIERQDTIIDRLTQALLGSKVNFLQALNYTGPEYGLLRVVGFN